MSSDDRLQPLGVVCDALAIVETQHPFPEEPIDNSGVIGDQLPELATTLSKPLPASAVNIPDKIAELRDQYFSIDEYLCHASGCELKSHDALQMFVVGGYALLRALKVQVISDSKTGKPVVNCNNRDFKNKIDTIQKHRKRVCNGFTICLWALIGEPASPREDASEEEFKAYNVRKTRDTKIANTWQYANAQNAGCGWQPNELGVKLIEYGGVRGLSEKCQNDPVTRVGNQRRNTSGNSSTTSHKSSWLKNALAPKPLVETTIPFDFTASPSVPLPDSLRRYAEGDYAIIGRIASGRLYFANIAPINQ